MIPPSPAGALDPEPSFKKMNLSSTSKLLVLTVTVVPLTVKSPLIVASLEIVKPENVGESPVCNPKSTAVAATPLVVKAT